MGILYYYTGICLYYYILYCTVLYYTILYYTILYHYMGILYYYMGICLYYIILYHTIVYYTNGDLTISSPTIVSEKNLVCFKTNPCRRGEINLVVEIIVGEIIVKSPYSV